MPYKSEKIIIQNTIYDRRVKLTLEDKECIRKLYKEGYSLRGLGRMFGVSHKTIKITVDAEAKERYAESTKQYCKEHRARGEEWARTMKEHRRYKQKLYVAGHINEKKL